MRKVSREQAIAAIRHQLLAMRSPGQPTCEIAAEKNLICRGFCRDSDTELRMRYADVIDVTGPRAEVEERAAAYHLRRQRQEGAALSCDVQYRFYEICRGWDDFSNEDLARFLAEMTGEKVHVVAAITPPVL